MKKSRLIKLLAPSSKDLSRFATGIHISDTCIRYAKFTLADASSTLTTFGQIKLPEGVVQDGRILSPQKVQQVLRELCAKEKITHVRASVPESAIGDDTTTTTLETYVDMFDSTRMKLISLELETEAIVRAVVPDGDTSAHLVVDFGETRTDIAVTHGGVIRFTETLLGENNSLENIQGEIRTHFMHWHSSQAQDGKPRPIIETMILTGDNPNLHELAEYFSTSFRATARVGVVWTNVQLSTHTVPKLTKNESPKYAIAIGLALPHVPETETVIKKFLL